MGEKERSERIWWGHGSLQSTLKNPNLKRMGMEETQSQGNCSNMSEEAGGGSESVQCKKRACKDSRLMLKADLR